MRRRSNHVTKTMDACRKLGASEFRLAAVRMLKAVGMAFRAQLDAAIGEATV